MTRFNSSVAVFTTPGAHTWTAPANVSRINLILIGGGGSGGGGGGGGGGCYAFSAGSAGGGGGSSGAFGQSGQMTKLHSVKVNPGQTYNLMVGAFGAHVAGGAGGAGSGSGVAGSPGTSGNSGTASSFAFPNGFSYYAEGGAGGNHGLPGSGGTPTHPGGGGNPNGPGSQYGTAGGSHATGAVSNTPSFNTLSIYTLYSDMNISPTYQINPLSTVTSQSVEAFFSYYSTVKFNGVYSSNYMWDTTYGGMATTSATAGGTGSFDSSWASGGLGGVFQNDTSNGLILYTLGADLGKIPSTTVAAASNGFILSSATTIAVASTSGFILTGGPQYLVIVDAYGGYNYVTYTGYTSNSFTGCVATGSNPLITGGLVYQPIILPYINSNADVGLGNGGNGGAGFINVPAGTPAFSSLGYWYNGNATVFGYGAGGLGGPGGGGGGGGVIYNSTTDSYVELGQTGGTGAPGDQGLNGIVIISWD